MIEKVLDSKLFIASVSALGSILITIFTQYILNRRGRLIYNVKHNQVGMSTDDAIFGSVKVTWKDIPIANLYLSSIKLVNESMRDYENVILKAFTDDTILLTERTEIVGTTHILKWTNEYAKELRIETGQQPSKEQFDLHGRQREYLIPTLNRGQIVRLTYLNAAKSPAMPSIWLDVLHKGVKLEFRVAPNKVLGVPQSTAALVGSVIGLLFIGTIVFLINSIWVVAILSFLFGLIAQIPGVIAIKAWKWLKHFFCD